ncbi:MAG: HAD family hydrolase [Sphingomicrobium sp.]
MWSGPRNLSTAMMRSFGSRADTFVSDEPFYGCFLNDTPLRHPMHDEVVAAMDCDWRSVLDTLKGDPPGGKPIWYSKQMWHHMTGPIGFADFAGFIHAFLIRQPERMVASYLNMRESADFADFALERQAEFFDREADRLGHAPAVIDANDVLRDPRAVLTALCAALDISWDEAMLRWSPGRRDTDGPWAPHWYKSVEATTGFGEPDDGPVALPEDARRLTERMEPYYQRLAEHKITA